MQKKKKKSHLLFFVEVKLKTYLLKKKTTKISEFPQCPSLTVTPPSQFPVGVATLDWFTPAKGCRPTIPVC